MTAALKEGKGDCSIGQRAGAGGPVACRGVVGVACGGVLWPWPAKGRVVVSASASRHDVYWHKVMMCISTRYAKEDMLLCGEGSWPAQVPSVTTTCVSRRRKVLMICVSICGDVFRRALVAEGKIARR